LASVFGMPSSHSDVAQAHSDDVCGRPFSRLHERTWQPDDDARAVRGRDTSPQQAQAARIPGVTTSAAARRSRMVNISDAHTQGLFLSAEDIMGSLFGHPVASASRARDASSSHTNRSPRAPTERSYSRHRHRTSSAPTSAVRSYSARRERGEFVRAREEIPRGEIRIKLVPPLIRGPPLGAVW